jgi:hypothetical protein
MALQHILESLVVLLDAIGTYYIAKKDRRGFLAWCLSYLVWALVCARSHLPILGVQALLFAGAYLWSFRQWALSPLDETTDTPLDEEECEKEPSVPEK